MLVQDHTGECARIGSDTAYDVAMPNIDEAAKGFELDLAGRVGAAVQARRKALKMTAVRLAERTQELGYPITRVSITKIETNNRRGKLDIAELLVLAAALNVPPVLLVFPNYPEGEVELLPAHLARSDEAVRWMSGVSVLPAKTRDEDVIDIGPGNQGVDLVGAVGRMEALEPEHVQILLLLKSSDQTDDDYEHMVRNHEERWRTALREIANAKAELWAHPKDEAKASPVSGRSEK